MSLITKNTTRQVDVVVDIVPDASITTKQAVLIMPDLSEKRDNKFSVYLWASNSNGNPVGRDFNIFWLYAGSSSQRAPASAGDIMEYNKYPQYFKSTDTEIAHPQDAGDLYARNYIKPYLWVRLFPLHDFDSAEPFALYYQNPLSSPDANAIDDGQSNRLQIIHTYNWR